MLLPDLFRDQPVQLGERVRLEPRPRPCSTTTLGCWPIPSSAGSRATFEPERVREWLASRPERSDRADWAAIRLDDGAFLGEAVLNGHGPDVMGVLATDPR